MNPDILREAVTMPSLDVPQARRVVMLFLSHERLRQEVERKPVRLSETDYALEG